MFSMKMLSKSDLARVLMGVISLDDPDALHRLMTDGVNIHEPRIIPGIRNALLPLMYAIRQGKRRIVDRLVSYGGTFDTNTIISETIEGNNALLSIHSTKFDQFNIDQLVHRYGCNVNHNALFAAISGAELSIIDHLVLIHGLDIYQRDQNGNTALMIGVRNGHPRSAEIISHLVHHYGLDVNAFNNDGDTALMLICLSARSVGTYVALKHIKLLLEFGANVLVKNNQGKTAANIASEYKLDNIADELKRWEVDHSPLSAQTSSSIPAIPAHVAEHACITTGSFCVIAPEVLSKARAQQDLFMAVRYGDNALIAHAIARGAEVDKSNRIGDTALLLAAYHGHITSIDYLVSCGANLHARNRDGDNALLLAAQRGHSNTIDHLVSLKLDVHTKNEDGDDALLLAIHNGHTATALHLASHHKLNAHTSNKKDMTAVMIAKERRQDDLVTKLMQLSAPSTAPSEPIPASSRTLSYPNTVGVFPPASSHEISGLSTSASRAEPTVKSLSHIGKE